LLPRPVPFVRSEVAPDLEWWDAAIVKGTTCSSQRLEVRMLYCTRALTTGSTYDGSFDETLITAQIQHPAIIHPLAEKPPPPPMPLPLTKKEQKKLRKARREAKFKEEQAQIRHGLVEPPPPRCKCAFSSCCEVMVL